MHEGNPAEKNEKVEFYNLLQLTITIISDEIIQSYPHYAQFFAQG